MKKIILIAFLLISVLSINAQVLRPSGLPTTNSPSRFDITGYQMDSAFLYVIRDTFPAKYPTVIWHTNGNFYKSPGGAGSHWSTFVPSLPGTVTSISQGFGIINTPNPITTTGIITADTSHNNQGLMTWSEGERRFGNENLQTVTDRGNSTTNSIKASVFKVPNSPLGIGVTDYSQETNAGLARWSIARQGLETGSDNGSNWKLYSFTDLGILKDSPITVNRNTSAITFTNYAYALNGKLIGSLDTAAMLKEYHYKADQTRILGEPSVYNAFPQSCTLNDTAWVIYSGNGTNHTGKFDIVAQYSTDGNNWVKQTLLTDPSFSFPNHGGGVNDIGEILVLAEVATGSGTNWSTYNTMNCYKKVGNSLVLLSANLPLNGCTSAAPFGKLVVLPSGALLQTMYGDNGSTYKCYTIISTDHGVTWSFNSNIVSSSTHYTEVAMTKVSGTSDGSTTLLAAIRLSTSMTMFISKNGGTTWTSCGLINPTESVLAVAPWLDVFNGNVMLMYADRTYGLMRTIQYDSIYVDSATVYANIPTNAVVNKVVQYSSLLNTKAAGDQTSGSFGYGSFFTLNNALFYACYDIDQNQRPPYGTGSTRLKTNIITNRFYQQIQTGQAYAKTVNAVDSIQGTAEQVLVNGTTGVNRVGNIILTLPQGIGIANTPQFAALLLKQTAGAITITNRPNLSTDNLLNKFANGGDSLYIGLDASTGGTFSNSLPYSGLIGTIGASPFHVATSNAVRSTWLANGNFGHGNTAPTSFFNIGTSNQLGVDVSGNLITTGTATAASLTTTGNADIGGAGTITGTLAVGGAEIVTGTLTVNNRITQSQTGSDLNVDINSNGRLTNLVLRHRNVVAAQYLYDSVLNRLSVVNSVSNGSVRLTPGSGASGSWDVLNNGALVQAGVGVPTNGNEKFHVLGTAVIRDSTTIGGTLTVTGGATFNSTIKAPSLPSAKKSKLVYYDNSDGQFYTSDTTVTTNTSYTPTITGIANVASSSGAVAYYDKANGYGTVYFTFVYTPTAGATATSIDINIPVGAVFSSASQAFGSGTNSASTNSFGAVFCGGNNGAATVRVSWSSFGTSSEVVAGSFRYQIQ